MIVVVPAHTLKYFYPLSLSVTGWSMIVAIPAHTLLYFYPFLLVLLDGL